MNTFATTAAIMRNQKAKKTAFDKARAAVEAKHAAKIDAMKARLEKAYETNRRMRDQMKSMRQPHVTYLRAAHELADAELLQPVPAGESGKPKLYRVEGIELAIAFLRQRADELQPEVRK